MSVSQQRLVGAASGLRVMAVLSCLPLASYLCYTGLWSEEHPPGSLLQSVIVQLQK